jgi:hypothetical protein
VIVIEGDRARYDMDVYTAWDTLEGASKIDAMR